jgi:O-antigen ligase
LKGERSEGRISSILGRVIFYALLLLIALVAIPYGTVEPWWEALFECVVFALGALWAVDGLLKRSLLTKAQIVFLPLLLLALYAFVQTLSLWGGGRSAGLGVWNAISADPYQTRLVALKFFALALAGVLLLRYTSDNWRLRALVITILAVAIASALFGILRQTTQRGDAGFLLPALKTNVGYGQFINRNHFAFLMEMGLGLALGFLVGGGVKRDRLLLYVAAALPLWAALILSNSRGGILSMFAQVVFAGLLFSGGCSTSEKRTEDLPTLSHLGRSLVTRIALVACLVVVGFVGAIWMGGDPLVSRLESVPGEVSAESDAARSGVLRKEIWHATWDLIKDHPVAGVGLGGYWVAITGYHDASGEMVPQEAHNDYLELLASGGIIALALAGWFIIALIKGARRTLRSNDSFRRGACLGALVGIFGVAVHSVVDFGLHITINAFVLVALVVMATAEVGHEEGLSGKREAF